MDWPPHREWADVYRHLAATVTALVLILSFWLDIILTKVLFFENNITWMMQQSKYSRVPGRTYLNNCDYLLCTYCVLFVPTDGRGKKGRSGRHRCSSLSRTSLSTHRHGHGILMTLIIIVMIIFSHDVISRSQSQLLIIPFTLQYFSSPEKCASQSHMQPSQRHGNY